MKLLEKDMEDLIVANPSKYLKEPELKLISRQYSIGNYRFDLLFEDRHQAKLIVEIQRGTLDRNHTYKILDYYDEYKAKNPRGFIDLMLIANKITRERRERLMSYGISFIEIPESNFIDDSNWDKIKQENGKCNSHESRSQKNNTLGGNMEIIETHKELMENLKTFDSYRVSTDSGAKEEHLNMIKKGIIFVVHEVSSKEYSFAPSRFVGYKNNTLSKHNSNKEKDGRITTPAIDKILGTKARPSSDLNKIYQQYCVQLGFTAKDKGSFGVERKFWKI